MRKGWLSIKPVCAVLLLCCCWGDVLPVQAQEKYRSKVYLDLDVDPTETVSLSVGELEKTLGHIQDEQLRANAERFLAQHYLNQKDDNQAAVHLERVLQQGATADRRLYLQLSSIYLSQQKLDKAAALLTRYLQQEKNSAADVPLLLAQIQYQRKQYVAAVTALDQALALQPAPDATVQQLALAIYYGAGQYARCAALLKQQVAQDMDNVTLWQQWVSLYLKAKEYGPALDAWALAWKRGLPFREQDVKLLGDLYAINGIPASGARQLEAAVANGKLSRSAALNDQLFRLWMLAGEREKAMTVLESQADSSADVELLLHLAQLYMEKSQWQSMQAVVLRACDGKLTERFVSRANLLLGISQLKLGETESARRSFINASLVGGEVEQAAQWLAWMKAEPATRFEKGGVDGPCEASVSGVVQP